MEDLMKTIAAAKTQKSLRSEFALVRLPLYAVTGPGTSGRATLSFGFRYLIDLYAAVVPSVALKLRVFCIALGVLAFLTVPTPAGTAEQAQLLQAQKLSDQGEFAQVIQILEPLVHSEPRALDDFSRGRAWNILGPAYEALGNYDAGRRSYEAAIELLRTVPDAGSMYASALNNLGSLELYMGQFHPAETALRKAKGMYTKSDDHAGLAEVATNLAILALDRNNTHAARAFLVDAFGEAGRAKGLSDSDRAEMYSTKGVVAARDRDFAAAVLDYGQSVDFWIRARGPKCYLVALQYTLRADAFRELGDYSKATSDITSALLLVAQTVGRNTALYAETELTYARLLRATGANAEAAQRETEAKAFLKTTRRQQCNNCSISSAAFR
jgi:tetratricopeptide (TPR) repeat protein